MTINMTSSPDSESSVENDEPSMESPVEDMSSEVSDDNDDLEDDADDESEAETTTPSGMADVMAKILRKQGTKDKNIILSKAQTDKQVARKRALAKDSNSEGVTAKKKVNTGDDDDSDDDDGHFSYREMKDRQYKMKLWENIAREKVNPLHKSREREFQLTATRGIVQLFNAVHKHQNVISEKLEEAGPSDSKKQKVLKSISKGEFLDMLKSKDPSHKNQSNEDKEDETTKPGWNVLRDDFLLDAKMKNWDKEVESDDSVK